MFRARCLAWRSKEPWALAPKTSGWDQRQCHLPKQRAEPRAVALVSPRRAAAEDTFAKRQRRHAGSRWEARRSSASQPLYRKRGNVEMLRGTRIPWWTGRGTGRELWEKDNQLMSSAEVERNETKHCWTRPPPVHPSLMCCRLRVTFRLYLTGRERERGAGGLEAWRPEPEGHCPRGAGGGGRWRF